jgi:hypothetical protein
MKNVNKNLSQKLFVQQLANDLGGIPALSKKLNITRHAIYKWYRIGIPPARAIEIENLSNGKLKASNLIKNIL